MQYFSYCILNIAFLDGKKIPLDSQIKNCNYQLSPIITDIFLTID